MRDHIEDANLVWKDIADGYVRPLRSREVRVQDDRFGIHHYSETIAKVMQSIVKHHETHAVAGSRDGVMSSSGGGVMESPRDGVVTGSSTG